MNKTITTIILGIFLISLVSAVDVNMIAGECNNLTFPNSNNVSIEVTGNSTDMEGFNWNQNGTLIEYCFDINFAPDSFTLRWYNGQADVVVSSRGGSGNTIYPKGVIEPIKNLTNVEDTPKEIYPLAYTPEKEIDSIVDIPEEESYPLFTIIILSLIVITVIVRVYFLKRKEGLKKRGKK